MTKAKWLRMKRETDFPRRGKRTTISRPTVVGETVIEEGVVE